MLKRDAEIKERWATRAAAMINDSGSYVRDVVRDLLANPHVRAVVFDGVVCCRGAYDKFWLGENIPAWRIDNEHQNLVRQFVDLYDDDCMWKDTPQPFWPQRVRYLEDQEHDDKEPKCV
jgi:hypothetical protein